MARLYSGRCSDRDHAWRSARKQFGWTLQQLAERSGVSITTISRAERGQLALGRALQVDMVITTESAFMTSAREGRRELGRMPPVPKRLRSGGSSPQ